MEVDSYQCQAQVIKFTLDNGQIYWDTQFLA